MFLEEFQNRKVDILHMRENTSFIIFNNQICSTYYVGVIGGKIARSALFSNKKCHHSSIYNKIANKSNKIKDSKHHPLYPKGHVDAILTHGNSG